MGQKESMRISIMFDQQAAITAFLGFSVRRKPTDETKVFTFESGEEYSGLKDLRVLEMLFLRFNGGEDSVVKEYYAAGMPSLSVGMMVVLDGRKYICRLSGWKKFDL